MVQFSERALNRSCFHGAVLQRQGERLPRADTHRRAGLEPGDLKFAQMTWKRPPGLGKCGRLTGMSPRPGTQLRRAQRIGGLNGRFIDGTAERGLEEGELHEHSVLPPSGLDNASVASRTGA